MDLENLPLGKKIKYPKKYDPALLVGISREEARARSGIKLKPSSFYGLDSWTAYELSWLDVKGVPKNGILYASYPSKSKNFIESKSFKLYLNSLNNKKFNSRDQLKELLTKDLQDCVSEEVTIEIKNTPRDFIEDCISIDSTDLNLAELKEGIRGDILEISTEEVNEKISCSLFRSLCPVTGQPDWATIRITYSGKLIIHEHLFSYLVSYRNHQAFHEECAEKIFDDLINYCKPKELTVQASYLRRGGIEINPIRSTTENFPKEVLRTKNQ